MREDSQKILYLLEITWRLKRHLTVKNKAKNLGDVSPSLHIRKVALYDERFQFFIQKSFT